MQNNFFQLYKTHIILFIEGMVSVSLQFLFMRAFLPFVGSSVGISSIIICTFLLALAMGYHYGGNLRDNFKEKLLQNFFLASILSAVGLSPLVSEAYFAMFGDKINIFFSVLLYSIIFMSPSIFLLGQTMPLLANSILSESKGKVSGTVLFFSTVGNVFGSLLTVLLLMYYFGFAISVFFNLLLLLILFILINENKQKAGIRAILVIVFSWLFLIQAENVLYDKANIYANYKIIQDNDQEKRLISNHTDQSKITSAGEGHAYIEKIKEKIKEKISADSEILVLGAGGFTLGHNDQYRKYTYVDIDGQIKDLVEKKFLQQKINGNFIHSDARFFLRNNQKLWDAIVLDAFGTRATPPAHLISTEYFLLVKSRLKEDGWVFINAILQVDFDSNFSQEFDNTVHQAFGACFVFEADLPTQNQTNIIYACKNKKNNNQKTFSDKFLSF